MQHVFISYVSENEKIVDEIYQELKLQGIEVWLDRHDLGPGTRWKREIRRAIQQGLFFIACFSKEYYERDKTYMNEELTVASEELRQRPADRVWFIPTKLNECEIPDIDIGRGETLQDLQYVSLYKNWDTGIQRILNTIQSEPTEPTENRSKKAGQDTDRNATTKSSGSSKGQDSVSVGNTSFDSFQNSKLTNWVFQQGNFFLMHKQIDRAVEAYTHAIDLDPNNADTHNNSGLAYSIKGNVEQAIEKYNRAIELKIVVLSTIKKAIITAPLKITLKRYSKILTLSKPTTIVVSHTLVETKLTMPSKIILKQ